MTPRQLALGGALAATLAATAWVATRPEDDAAAAVAAPARRAASVAAAASAASAPAPAVPSRVAWADAPASQLAAWQPPPPPPPPPAPPPVAAPPPPPPVAPPAPYQMIGRVIEGEGAKAVEVALLTGPNKALSAKRGDVIDGQWRVEQVSDSGVRLTWLPGQLPQNIVFRPVP
ncbi:hypothetical protein J2X20_005603 [Pelomonas saccharophila]|uniref:Uncharacterized protein n=1 Tax=Roseateles saccharophilus TaxID=304 RepID=A0ABU1YVN6_ROSSA|nr:hypothetical protein [Roseateles saccharophilus]MDR7272918.1 hypothetical protein [Roseateles saccharophilus]